jgi:hypothetical protein
MADKKISELTGATTPLAGTEEVPLVQGGATKKATVAQMSADKAPLATPSFTSTIGVGGATAAASGAGVTFPATASLSTDPNTLDDYEEGTWTPTFVPQTGSFTTVNYGWQRGTYRIVGDMVFISVYMTSTTDSDFTGGSGRVEIAGLPFSVRFSSTSDGRINSLTIGLPVSNWGISSSTGPQLFAPQGNQIRIMFIDPTVSNRTRYVDVTELATAAGNRNSVVASGWCFLN